MKNQTPITSVIDVLNGQAARNQSFFSNLLLEIILSFPGVLVWASPEADPETWTWEQVVFMEAIPGPVGRRVGGMRKWDRKANQPRREFSGQRAYSYPSWGGGGKKLCPDPTASCPSLVEDSAGPWVLQHFWMALLEVWAPSPAR